jgi:hypothetical protein
VSDTLRRVRPVTPTPYATCPDCGSTMFQRLAVIDHTGRKVKVWKCVYDEPFPTACARQMPGFARRPDESAHVMRIVKAFWPKTTEPA